jgi:hypothetical protein
LFFEVSILLPCAIVLYLSFFFVLSEAYKMLPKKHLRGNEKRK